MDQDNVTSFGSEIEGIWLPNLGSEDKWSFLIFLTPVQTLSAEVFTDVQKVVSHLHQFL